MPDRVFCRRHDPDGHANWDSGFRPLLDDTCYMCAAEQLEQQLKQAHRAAEESAKDAHRAGWIQCQREVVTMLQGYMITFKGDGFSMSCSTNDAAIAIAALEYKEPTNEY